MPHRLIPFSLALLFLLALVAVFGFVGALSGRCTVTSHTTAHSQERTLARPGDYAGHDRHPPTKIILDMDSSVSPTHGDQEGTAYNGHFGCTFHEFGWHLGNVG